MSGTTVMPLRKEQLVTTALIVGHPDLTASRLSAALTEAAHRLGMRWQPPVVVHGVRDLDQSDVDALMRRFADILTGAREGEKELVR